MPSLTAFIAMPSQTALIALWATVGLNFVFGGIIWLSNQGNQYSSRGRPDVDAITWTAIGTNLVGFAVLVAVVTLAAHAIVGAIEENAKSK